MSRIIHSVLTIWKIHRTTMTFLWQRHLSRVSRWTCSVRPQPSNFVHFQIRHTVATHILPSPSISTTPRETQSTLINIAIYCQYTPLAGTTNPSRASLNTWSIAAHERLCHFMNHHWIDSFIWWRGSRFYELVYTLATGCSMVRKEGKGELGTLDTLEAWGLQRFCRNSYG
jgi:hypothetical protein